MLRVASIGEASAILIFVLFTQVNGREYQTYVGETVSLSCSTQEDNAPDWTFKAAGEKLREVAREGEVINGWKERGATVRREKPRVYILEMPQVGVNDTGIFRCIEDAGLGNIHEFQLRVSDEPMLYPTYTVGIGQMIMLPCFTSLETKVDWKFKPPWRSTAYEIAREGAMINGWATGREIQSNMTGDFSLTLSNLELNDTGKYSCIEDEGLGEEHVHYVRVSDMADTTVVRTTPGTPVAFVCTLRNTSRLRWQHIPRDGDMTLLYNGYKVQDQSGRLSVSCDAKTDRCVLVINNVVDSDAGTYVCLSSETSSIRQQFELDMIEPVSPATKQDDPRNNSTADAVNFPAAAVIVVMSSIAIAVVIVTAIIIICWCIARSQRPRQPAVPMQEVDEDATDETAAVVLLLPPPYSAEHGKEETVRLRPLPAYSDLRCTFLRTDSLDCNTDYLYGIAELYNNLWFILRSRCGTEHRLIRVNGLDADRVQSPSDRHDASTIKIPVENLTSLNDIAACHEHGIVYVAGFCEPYDEGRVWRIKPDGSQVGQFLPQGEPGIRFKPHSLSVYSGRLLVTSLQFDELTLYDVDGRNIAVIPLRTREPTHAVEMSDRSFVVCCLKPQFSVCQFDMRARLLRSYTAGETLNGPNYLALDPTGRVFVADLDNSRIVVLTPNLDEQMVVECPAEAQDYKCPLPCWPWQMCFVESTSQLLVTSAMSCVVHIFTCVSNASEKRT